MSHAGQVAAATPDLRQIRPGRDRNRGYPACAKEDGLIRPTRKDFQNNLRFRVTLRRFLHWSEEQAAAAGLTPAQHQLLVAIKGHPGPEPPAIRDLAEYLLLQSHSAVGLVDRAEAAGVVYRQQDDKDSRVVRVLLTEKGDQLVRDLTQAHLSELYKLAEALGNLLPATRQEGSGPGAEPPIAD